jgi:hypothetical protein
MKKPMSGRSWAEEALARMSARKAEHDAKIAALEARMEQARKRMEEAQEHHAAVRRALYAELMARRSGQPKPPRPRKGRPDEGGEPMPAVPRPKPKPLSGGAAAPLKFMVPVPKTASQPPRVKTRPAKVPSETDRSPSL